MALNKLIYVSQATPLFNEEEDLIKILDSARAFNHTKNITGMLLYVNGIFVQLLEGSLNDIQELFDKISRDPRHNRIVKLIESPIENRLCGEWDMGVARVAESQLYELGFNDAEELLKELGNNSDSSNILLNSILKNNLASGTGF